MNSFCAYKESSFSKNFAINSQPGSKGDYFKGSHAKTKQNTLCSKISKYT